MRLNVWLDGHAMPAGHLETLDNGAVRFSYTLDYLSQGPLPISMSLPLQEAAFDDARTRAFFDNLLPENDQLQRVLDRERLSRDDIVGIMYHVGADCSGAISCLPEGAPPVKVPGDLAEDYEPVSESEVEAILHSLSELQRLPDETQDPSPLAGVQGKIALTVLPDGRWALPKPGRKVPSTHILKVAARADQDDVKAEWAANFIADIAGLSVLTPQIVGQNKAQGLLISRFDRVINEGKVSRLHQEDFAQAIGLSRRLKYERNGLPDHRFDAETINRLLEQTALPAENKRVFLRATFYNLALGNNDNHAKNHALLYQRNARPNIAPFYDLMPARLSGRYTDELSFNIGNARKLEAIKQEDISYFLSEFGLKGAGQKRFISRQIKPLLQSLEDLSPMLPLEGLKSLDDLIGQNLSHLNEIMGLGLNLRERDAFVVGGGGWSVS